MTVAFLSTCELRVTACEQGIVATPCRQRAPVASSATGNSSQRRITNLQLATGC
jgi:hypothetical protein